jgi:large subunit ribosomal protein L13
MKTISAKTNEVERIWYEVDAEGIILGRLASRVAAILRGKNKPIFTPHVDCGDFVVVINAEKIHLTGSKLQQKMYHHYSGYPGGLKSENAASLLNRRPELVIEKAIKGMLPKNILGRKMFTKLKVYAGPEHPHQAQQPQKIVFDAREARKEE